MGLGRVYGLVVAFVPSGWADGLNWNRMNVVIARQVDLERAEMRFSGSGGGGGDRGGTDRPWSIDVGVRLVASSKHSAAVLQWF